jgi:hypothetical protein
MAPRQRIKKGENPNAPYYLICAIIVLLVAVYQAPYLETFFGYSPVIELSSEQELLVTLIGASSNEANTNVTMLMTPTIFRKLALEKAKFFESSSGKKITTWTQIISQSPPVEVLVHAGTAVDIGESAAGVPFVWPPRAVEHKVRSIS